MDSGNQLLTILIVLGVWSTLSTVIILVTRRHVKLGFKIWFMKRLGKEPLLIRYHGANKRVREMIISTKGIHETVEIVGKKFFIFKDDNGETFFIDQASMRTRDDDVNEITYNYASIMPADMTLNEELVLKYREQWMVDMQAFQEQHTLEGRAPVDVETMVKYTDPKRLNEFIKLTYLVAKKQALSDAANWEKWVKVGVFASIGAAIIGILVWYNLDGKIMPLLQAIAGQVSTIATGVSHGINATATVPV
jgi:hypothetical protein